jgi:hypothetical protein
MRSLRSNSPKIFIAKVWGPLLWIAGGIGVFGRHFPGWRFWLVCPLFVVALFGFSVAIVEVHDGVLRYRRFFRWKTIDPKDITGVKAIWEPILASVRLKRFLFPWGRLYFVLDGPSTPFHKEYRLLDYIRELVPRVPEMPPRRSP